jgi:uncharacterized protein with PQ loop repeat
VLIAIFSALAIAANIAFVWPQAVRLLRSGDLAGVSPGTWTISIVLFSVWSAFAISTEYWALLVANASCLAAATLIMAAGTRSGWPARWAVLGVVGVGSAALAGVFAPVVLAVVMTGAGVALRIPQLLMLLRTSSVEGVSATTWLLGAATAACWLIVSLSKGATAVVIANSTALAATLLLLAVLAVRKYAKP